MNGWAAWWSGGWHCCLTARWCLVWIPVSYTLYWNFSQYSSFIPQFKGVNVNVMVVCLCLLDWPLLRVLYLSSTNVFYNEHAQRMSCWSRGVEGAVHVTYEAFLTRWTFTAPHINKIKRNRNNIKQTCCSNSFKLDYSITSIQNLYFYKAHDENKPHYSNRLWFWLKACQLTCARSKTNQ